VCNIHKISPGHISATLYIICDTFSPSGGLGGIGLELADWLVLRGARKLVLSSRSGVRTGYQSLRVRLWRSYSATVVISQADITTESGVKELLSDANHLGQVDAIFNLAVVSVKLPHICDASNC
jgi:NAD(P)-dependent dehydrogenase (short-subunit alcohol dehydrogenase family)